jgi:hypothetical protein
MTDYSGLIERLDEEIAEYGKDRGEGAHSDPLPLVLRAARDALERESVPDLIDCPSEIHSWKLFTPEQVDSYWITCNRTTPHIVHGDSNTGATWDDGADRLASQ